MRNVRLGKNDPGCHAASRRCSPQRSRDTESFLLKDNPEAPCLCSSVVLTDTRARLDRGWRPAERPTSYNARMSVSEHRKAAPAVVRAFVLTISDTRTEDNDTSGDAIVGMLQEAGHTVTGRQIVRDDPVSVREVVRRQAVESQVIITTGGTGITARDSTFEAISSLIEKQLDGFGELFRTLSYAEIGSAAMMSRACAGTVGRTIVFSLPGSEHAVRLAMSKLILPEVGHIVREITR